MSKIKVKVVALSTTDQSAKITECLKSYTLDADGDPIYSECTFYDKQHLYFTSDEKIEVDDYYFDGTDFVHRKSEYNKDLVDGNKDARKIVATTDTSLWEHDDTVPYPKTRPALPQIPQSFIKQYVDAGGKIDEVEIKYEQYWEEVDNKYPNYPQFKIKVDSNNCVIISKSKDSWSREEVEDLPKRCYYDADICDTGETIEDWIKDNL